MVNQAIFELAIAPQTAKGAAAATAMFKTRVTGGDIAPSRNIVDLVETGRNRLNRQAIVGAFGADGNPSVALRPDVAGLLMLGALGANQTTGAADPYSHAATPGAAIPYFTLWRNLGDLIYEKFVDCKIGQLELISEAGDSPWLNATATFVGRTSTRLDAAAYGTAVAVAYSDARPFVHYDGSGLFLVENVAIAEMERIALTIMNGAARQPGDSLGADDVSEGKQRITVVTRQRVATATKNLYDRLHYGTASPTSGAGPNPNVVELGAGGLDFKWVVPNQTPERSLRIQGSRVQVKSITGMTPGTGDDPYRGEVTYEIYDAVSPFTATTKNGQTSYAAV